MPVRRILQVVSRMDRGGVETWLMHVLRHIDRGQFRMDFLVRTTEHCEYDDEIRALGSALIPGPSPAQWWTYGKGFRTILREHGPYEAVHCHELYLSGYVLRLADHAGVPVRIAHSHNTSSTVTIRPRLLARALVFLAKRMIPRHATTGLAASNAAGAALFGTHWGTDMRFRILHCGLDFAPFRGSLSPAAVRQELGIPPGALVVGHVGRFSDQKNHRFLVDVAAELARREPRAHFLLVGVGPLRPAIEQKVAEAGIADRVVFAGARDDVPRLMRAAMDVFLFPSLYEGLGLVLVEAQAAGLPSVLSDVVPEEADLVKPLMRRLPLSQPASAWADAVLAARERGPGIPQAEALATVERSDFNIATCVEELKRIYLGQASAN